MTSSECRNDPNIAAYSPNSKDLNWDTSLDKQIVNNDIISIWCDTSIQKERRQDQYTLSCLQNVSKHVITFTDIEGCLRYIDRFDEKNKLLLIVSGSLGESFVPRVYHRTQISLIYIFCARKSRHEVWVKKYAKIKGVFETIGELCEVLKEDKKKLEDDQVQQQILDYVQEVSPWLVKFAQSRDMKNLKHIDDYQPSQDDLKKSMKPATVFSSQEKAHSTTQELETDHSIQCSDTVTPYTPYKQHMEFADTGIWPCVSTINSTRNALVNHLHSAIETVQYFNSIENFQEHFHHHPIDPHFIIISNPSNIESLIPLNHHRVRKLYIYCCNDRLAEYDTWRDRHPEWISVLQHVDTLTRLILWDLSACIVDIGNYYDRENRQDLARIRFRYAYRIHCIIEGMLNHRRETIEFYQLSKLND